MEDLHHISFSNVPFSAVNRKWQTVGKHRWKGHGTLPVFEARAALHAVKHTLRSTENFGKKHLILSDSMTATCAISRGRAQSFGLRRVCAQIGALALVSNSSFHLRWIPGEWNPADNPSRGKWEPSIPVRDLGHGFSERTSAPRAFEMERDKTSQEKITTEDQQGEDCSHSLGEFEGDGCGVDSRAKRCKEESQSGGKSKASSADTRANSPRGCCSVSSSPQPICTSLGNSEALGFGKQGNAVDRETHRSELTEHLEEIYYEGDDVSSAQYLIAAVLHYNPFLRSPQLLPRVRQSLKGWRKICPPRSRLPIPWEVTCLLVTQAIHEGCLDLALHMLVMFSLYLRPSEALRLRNKDIVAPVKRKGSAYLWWSFVLHPFECGVPSKTLEFDETLVLDLPYHKGIGQALRTFAGRQQQRPADLVFNHKNADLNQFLDNN